jgi:DNA gyrase subunit A
MEKTEENIIKRTIEKEMQTAYMDYAMSVIVSRALPDVRDRTKTSTQKNTIHYE